MTRRVARFLVPLGAVTTLLVPGVSAAIALLLGIGLALAVGNPWPEKTRGLAARALAGSVIGLGAAMDLRVVGRVGLHGAGYTAIGIGTALLIGGVLGRRLRVARDTSLLVTVGTAICGGTAIAAVAPGIRAREEEVSVALVTVFLLNGIALVVFPVIGHTLHLGQDAFGLWCALAIHDTSSVVGAAAQYGERALQVATAAKLARALWIVPVASIIAFRRRSNTAPKRPWFIAGFLGVAALVTFVPALRGAGHVVAAGAHRMLSLSLFGVGLGLTRAAIRKLGVRPLAQATTLWLILAAGTLAAIEAGLVT